MEEILKKIADFADKAHDTQKRKYAPDRYIVHPIRVMEMCRKHSDDLCILAAALLHDVLEDTPVQKDKLRDFLLTLMNPPMTDKVLAMVTDLTDVYVKKDYPHLKRRVRKNKELQRLEKTSAGSQTIKYADIIDNTGEIVNEDPDFAPVYLHECKATLRKLDKGNTALQQQAIETVDDQLLLLKKREGTRY